MMSEGGESWGSHEGGESEGEGESHSVIVVRGGDWYTCSYCKKNFPSKSECSSHRRREHRGQNGGKRGVKSPLLIVLCEEEEGEEGVTEEEGGEDVQEEALDLGVRGKVILADEEHRGPVRSTECQETASRVSRKEPNFSEGGLSVEGEKLQSPDRGQSSRPIPIHLSIPIPIQIPTPTILSVSRPIENPNSTLSIQVVKREIQRPSVIVTQNGSTNIMSKYPEPFLNHSPFPHFQGEKTPFALQRVGIEKQGLSFSSIPPPSFVDPALLPRGKKSPGKTSENQKKTRNKVTVIPGHIHVHEREEGKVLYECTVCKKRFKTKANVKYHEFCLDPGQRPLTCGDCGKKFSSLGHLNYHLLTHTGERPFKCPELGCESTFSQKGKLNRHMRKHTGEKRHSCFLCAKKFCTRQSVKQHMLIHTGERRYVCKHCDKRFTGQTNLRKHIITHTGEKPWSCSTCGKSFGLKWSRDLHMRTHQPHLYDHCCDVCGRTFAAQKDLRRHSMIHTGERPFNCPECKGTFRRRDNMARHLKQVHAHPAPLALKVAASLPEIRGTTEKSKSKVNVNNNNNSITTTNNNNNNIESQQPKPNNNNMSSANNVLVGPMPMPMPMPIQANELCTAMYMLGRLPVGFPPMLTKFC